MSKVLVYQDIIKNGLSFLDKEDIDQIFVNLIKKDKDITESCHSLVNKNL